MDPERERIQADLRGVVTGDVLCDDLHLQLYASDASLYEIRPLAVLRPRTTRDIVAAVQYSGENRLPLHVRGAGTGLAGESLGAGLVLDCSAYLRRILGSDAATVRVQPGVVHAHLNEFLRGQGRIFGPDPAMSRVTTLGSMIAIDASGSHWPKYGSTRDHVQELQVVLDTGEVLQFGREPRDPAKLRDLSPRRREIVERLEELLDREAALIQRKQPAGLTNRCGYRLEGVLGDDYVDVAKLLSGSEGTLAIISEAILRTQLLPRASGLAVLFFDRLESAALAVQDILPLRPTACDLLDRRHLSLARETDPRYHQMIPPEAEALLLVEQTGETLPEMRRQVAQILDMVRNKRHLAFDGRQAFERDEVALYWQLASRVVPTLHRTKGASRPIPFIEDVAVPPSELPAFLPKMQNVFKRHQVVASLYGHVGHGQLHLRPFLDLSNPDDVRKIEALAADLYHEVCEVGGTISGEHGDGLSRTPFIRQQYGELYPVFQEVKQIFDPKNLLNPGKIISDDTDSLTKYIRPTLLRSAPAAGGGVHGNGDVLTGSAALSAPPPAVNGAPAAASAALSAGPVITLQLAWTAGEMEQAAARCNGCGACRAQTADTRMCPIFRFAPTEEASPRAKANLVRALFDGRLPPESMATDDFKQIADLCVNCHMCRQECPSNVDVPKLMMEAKGQYVSNNGLRPSDWMLSRLDWYATIGSLFGPIANWALSNRPARWMLEKLMGIAQGRKLPRFAKRHFMRRAAKMRLTRPTRRTGNKVAYFVDTYATYHDPLLAEALVAVLEHNGVAVYVPPGQWTSGMALISAGALDAARRIAKHNVELLAEAIRQGYHVITAEPSAALALTHEYRNLLNDDDARLVAENTSEACTYLWNLHNTGKLQLDFRPVNATLGYHLPCHLKVLEVGTPGENLMRLIPGLSVQSIDKGCSGMAGTFGLKRENFRHSIRAGWGLISSLRGPQLQFGTTECSACKMQMEQGTTKPTIHPLKLLALSYGLMPELASLLTTQGEELIVT
ncbi:MAG TPA: anaerobic glycerol-3-phosphate dehydrogenase subunit C [Pirellulales bacterium]|nr:anaerobic glycerol-3-phosphate dehydrogenase subunit C [Pirellulales bacterium]